MLFKKLLLAIFSLCVIASSIFFYNSKSSKWEKKIPTSSIAPVIQPKTPSSNSTIIHNPNMQGTWDSTDCVVHGFGSLGLPNSKVNACLVSNENKASSSGSRIRIENKSEYPFYYSANYSKEFYRLDAKYDSKSYNWITCANNEYNSVMPHTTEYIEMVIGFISEKDKYKSRMCHLSVVYFKYK